MLKVLLVDDEPIITKGLKKLIRWEELGYEIIGDADNGEEAWRLTDEKRPDIIITDLYMPVMGGIDFIRKISEACIKAKVIVLSGYGEFEYSREAFRHGAVEYLLKPVTREKLAEVLKNVSDAIYKERKAIERTELLKAQLRESMPLLRQKFLLDLIKGEISGEKDLARMLELLDIDLSGCGYTVFAVSIDEIENGSNFNREKDRLLLKFAAENIAGEVVEKRFKGFAVTSGEILYTLLVSGKKNTPVDEIFDVAARIRESLYEYLNIMASVGISREYENISMIEKAYNEANYALKFKYSLGSGQVIHINNVAPLEKNKCEYPQEAERKVIDAVIFDSGADAGELSAFLAKRFMEASAGKIELLYDYCLEFLVQLRRNLRAIGESQDGISPFAGTARNDLRQYRTVPELFSWLSGVISDAVEYVLARRRAREYDVIQEARNYIDSNFTDDLSLNAVAGRVYMSPTYFSALFKSKTGENFSDYVTRVKMEKAAKMLNDNMYKTYEVAGVLGYKNPRYFSEAFKKYHGLTPSEYREKLTGEK